MFFHLLWKCYKNYNSNTVPQFSFFSLLAFAEASKLLKQWPYQDIFLWLEDKCEKKILKF